MNNTFNIIMAVVLIFICPAIYTNFVAKDTTNVASTIGYAQIDVEKYEESIELDRLCYLTAEASQKGFIKNVLADYLEIKNNTAEGWKHLKEDTYDSGLSWALWQNVYDKNTYCLVYAGTDQILDTLSYIPMMTNEKYCTQMNEAIVVANTIDKYINTDINKLYIIGHSLGGYLASYVMSDLVDSSLSSDTHSRLKVSDINADLKLDKVECITFGAPGFYYKTINWPVVNKPILKITKWGEEKLANNAAKKYDKYISNHINKLDPVGHLFIAPNNFKHLGKVKDYNVTRLPSGNLNEFYRSLKKFDSLKDFIQTNALNITDIYYHLPHVYINLI